MLRKLRERLMRNYPSSEQPSSAEETCLKVLLDAKCEDIFDLEVLCTLAKVSKCFSTITSRWVSLFRNIVIGINGLTKLTEEEIFIYDINGHYTKGHSVWFIAAAFHHRVDSMTRSPERVTRFKEPSRMTCMSLGCPSGCGRFLNEELKLTMLHPQVPRSKVAQSQLRQSPLKDYIVPWLLYSECSVEEVVTFLVREPRLLKKYSVLIRESSLMSKYWTALYDSLTAKGFLLSKDSGIYSEDNALNGMRLILSDSDSYFNSRARDVCIGLAGFFDEHSPRGLPTAIRILQPKTGTNRPELKIIHVSIADGFALFFDRGAAASCLVFSAAAIAMQLATGEELQKSGYWPIPTPIGVNVICILCDSVLHRGIAGSFASVYNGVVNPYVRFIVLTWLFGIPESVIITTDDALIPVAFESRELFTTRCLMVSDIIFELGGRSSSSYLLFRTKCIDLLCRIRKHYVFIMTLLSPTLHESVLKEIIYRWVPGYGGEPASIAHFTDALDCSAKGTLGIWTIVGY